MASTTTQSWAAATQSWASWLLDSYASSVSPVASDHDEDSQPPSEFSSHQSQSSFSSVSTSSAYGPYMRSGRGGAGNFTWESDLKLAPRSSSPVNLEANLPKRRMSLLERRNAAARLENINTQEIMRLRQHSAQHLGVGRGGAGNYAVNDMKPLTRSTTMPAMLISPSTPKPPSPKHQNSYPVVHAGRGGAGNYAAAAHANGQAETEREQEERLAAHQRREQIVEEVDGLLQPPPGAWLGGRRKSTAIYEV